MSAPMAATAHQITSRALGWIHRFQHLGEMPADTTAELTDPDSTYKSLGETALAASLIIREGVASPGQLRAARELLEFVWAQFRGGDLLYERQLRYPLMTDPLELYAHLVRGEYRHQHLDELLAHLHRMRGTNALEMLPNRRLAVANAARIVGLAVNPAWDTYLAATWLGATPEPWAIDWTTAYNLTHTVFHGTDWGAHPDGLPTGLRQYLSAWLPVWLEVWTEIGQWDLVAELLIVDACLPQPVCPTTAWQHLASIQRPDGLLPRDTDPVQDDPAQAFKTHHHPTTVATIAGTLGLSRTLQNSVTPS
jgi:hypothetical protein